MIFFSSTEATNITYDPTAKIFSSCGEFAIVVTPPSNLIDFQKN